MTIKILLNSSVHDTINITNTKVYARSYKEASLHMHRVTVLLNSWCYPV